MAIKYEIVASLGFLEIGKCRDTKTHQVSYTATYMGNMGATVLTHVKPLFDKIYGDGSFDQVMNTAQVYGDPSYEWTMKFDNLPE